MEAQREDMDFEIAPYVYNETFEGEEYSHSSCDVSEIEEIPRH